MRKKIILFLFFFVVSVQYLYRDATPMSGKWSSQYLPNIPTKICFSSFSTWFPDYNQTKIENNILNAITRWNIQGGANVRFNYLGDYNGSACNPNQYENGYIIIRAEKNFPNSNNTLAAVACPTGSSFTKCALSFYRCFDENCQDKINWTNSFPSDSQISFEAVAVHELGHTLGMDHNNSPVYTAMPTNYIIWMRNIWQADIVSLRYHSTYGYGSLSSRYVNHKRSTNNGYSWGNESNNLVAATNLKPAVAFGTLLNGSKKYVVAWADSNGYTGTGHYIKTIMGNGVNFDQSTLVQHDYKTFEGPSITYGNGWFILAYTIYLDQHYIYVERSQDGINWIGNFVYIPGTSNRVSAYGSPVVAYMSTNTSKYFILAWVNFPYNSNRNQYLIEDSKMYTMVSNDNGNSWMNMQIYNNSYVTPLGFDIFCRNDANQCILAYPIGDGNNRIRNHMCNIFFGSFVCWDYSTTVETTRVNPSLTYGNGYWLLGWRGQDSSTSINTARKTDYDPSYPWVDKVTLDQTTHTPPSLTYSSYYNEFVLYYAY